jgi:two-component system sensor histidine kinase CpxA
VEILDSGPGVPESMLSDIFRPFFRASPGRENNGASTGLGLSIAAEAVRLHNGTIAAQNRAEGGLRVTISLPCRNPKKRQPNLNLFLCSSCVAPPYLSP